MLRISCFIILTIMIVGFSFSVDYAFAESETFTVASRDYERKYISLTAGDEIE